MGATRGLGVEQLFAPVLVLEWSASSRIWLALLSQLRAVREADSYSIQTSISLRTVAPLQCQLRDCKSISKRKTFIPPKISDADSKTMYLARRFEVFIRL